jgi:hypothetical protein
MGIQKVAKNEKRVKGFGKNLGPKDLLFLP